MIFDDLTNDPNDMGGDSWKGSGPDESLGKAVSELAKRLLVQRVQEVESRIFRLLAAGVPMNRLSLYEKNDCQCHGSGVVIEQTDVGVIAGRTCEQCLGVAMIIDKRTNV